MLYLLTIKTTTMKKLLPLTLILPVTLIFYLFTSFHNDSTTLLSAATNDKDADPNGCQEIVTVQALDCNCAGGFVFINSRNQTLIPAYPLPHNPQLQDGQQFRANYVIEDPYQVVIDCFDLGCAATGYLTDFKCLQKVK